MLTVGTKRGGSGEKDAKDPGHGLSTDAQGGGVRQSSALGFRYPTPHSLEDSSGLFLFSGYVPALPRGLLLGRPVLCRGESFFPVTELGCQGLCSGSQEM